MTGIPDPASSFEGAGSIKNATVIEGRDPKTGQFLKGAKGVGGRKRGSRVKLVEDVVSDVLESWQRDGPVALARVAALDPSKYLDFIAKVLPREVKVEHATPIDGLTDDQLERLLAFAEAKMAEAKTIEGEMRNITPSLPPPLADAPPTSAQQRAEAVRRDMEDQHEAELRRNLF